MQIRPLLSDIRTASGPAPPAARITSLVLLLLMISGCALHGERERQPGVQMPPVRADLFQPRQPVPDFESMLALDDEQRATFMEFFNSGTSRRLPPNRRVHAFLDQYLGDAVFTNETLSAADAIQRRAGNCMSLALVTTAFAEAAGIEVGWQLANTAPVYSSQGTVIYSANHIQTRLYEEKFKSTSYAFSIGREYLLIDYFNNNLPENGTPLDRAQVAALVYQNLGVERMAENDLTGAYWHFVEGLKHDPNNWNLYNALAIAHRRTGDAQTAEALYSAILDRFGDRLIVLRNYRSLLLAQDRVAEAEQIEQRLLRMRDPDPFPMIELGDEALAEGEPRRALEYYDRARKVAPYMHEVYFRMAMVHLQQGDVKRAERAFRKARENAFADRDKQLYEAKMQALAEGRH